MDIKVENITDFKEEEQDTLSETCPVLKIEKEVSLCVCVCVCMCMCHIDFLDTDCMCVFTLDGCWLANGVCRTI